MICISVYGVRIYKPLFLVYRILVWNELNDLTFSLLGLILWSKTAVLDYDVINTNVAQEIRSNHTL